MKSAISTGLGITVLGSVQGARDDPRTVRVGNTISLDDTEPGTEEEWIQMKQDEMSGLTPEEPSPGTNLKYVSHWRDTHTDTEGCLFGENVFDGEHSLTVYKAMDNNGDVLQDGDGDYRYMIEIYSDVEKISGADCEFQLTEVFNTVDGRALDGHSHVSFEHRTPAESERINDDRIPVRETIGVGEIEYGVDEIVRLDDGRFGGDSWVPGPGGKYDVRWWDAKLNDVDYRAYIDIAADVKFEEDWDGHPTGLQWSWDVEYHDGPM